MKKDLRVYLTHILECVERIEQYTVDGYEYFAADTKTQDAVIRNLEIIGEAAKRLDEDFRAAFPDIPWRRMAGMRDVLIHQYEGVDFDEIWRVVERDLPSLKETILRVLPVIGEATEHRDEDDSRGAANVPQSD